MNYIAVSGPIFSGKSTLADELTKLGYMPIIFTDLLKQFYASALTLAGRPTTVEDIKARKDYYRRALQDFGSHIGFDDDPHFVSVALRPWYAAGRPPLVLDNPRTDEQAVALHDHGISVVKLDISQESQGRRAQAKGVSKERLDEMMAHPCEQGISEYLIDGLLPATVPVSYLGRHVIDVLEDR
jgi:hypothetical protein